MPKHNQRHGIACLPEVDGDKLKRQRFKRYSICCPERDAFHSDIAVVRWRRSDEDQKTV